jgi:hypothetical protein
MSKSPIQFAGILFLLTAILAVSGQETITASINASLNNTTLLNNTTQNATTSEPAIAAENESAIQAPAALAETANETALNDTVTNETAATESLPVVAPEATPSENATPAIEAVPAIPLVQPGGMMIGSVQKTTFAVSSIGRAPNQFSIDGKALAQDAYEVGLPAKTIMDLSALPFFINKF